MFNPFRKSTPEENEQTEEIATVQFGIKLRGVQNAHMQFVNITTNEIVSQNKVFLCLYCLNKEFSLEYVAYRFHR